MKHLKSMSEDKELTEEQENFVEVTLVRLAALLGIALLK